MEFIPEEFLDPLVNDFAYDPIRLPVKEDRAQMLYNRRTLEKIWDTQHNAVNPYNRKPFDIRDAIPQTQLRQQMSEYIVENSRSCLEVIPVDYTKPLSSTDMENLLSELNIASKHCLTMREKRIDEASKALWKVLWQKLNLLRLCCQYTAENREIFLYINGYKYLFNAINPSLRLFINFHFHVSEDTKDVWKEVAKIVDIVGLKEKDLQTVPPDYVSAFLRSLYDLTRCEQLKIESMVLRIYRRMYTNCIDYLLRGCNDTFFINSLYLAISMLFKRQNVKNITNEDLYNGTTILKAAWINWEVEFYVDALVKVITVCISRFQDLHAAATRRAQVQAQAQVQVQAEASLISNNISISRHDHEEEKNIHLISSALHQGLFLIDCLVMADQEKELLRDLDIVKDIVKMVELVLAGVKFFDSSHLRFGLNITESLCRRYGKLSVSKGNNLVKVFGDFLGSHTVDEYDPPVKRLLREIVRSAFSVWH